MTTAAISLPLLDSNHDGFLLIIRDCFLRLFRLIETSLFRPIALSGMAETHQPENADEANRCRDLQYVEQVKSGDNKAFEELVYCYQDMIYNLCVRMLGNRADGEDAAQETFVKAYEAIQGFKGEAAFSTWLYRIAVNVCRNVSVSFWTRFSRKAVRLDKPVEDGEGGVQEREVPFAGLTPEQALERKRETMAVHDAIAKLPEKHREIIVLADIQELSNEEIRKITGLNQGTIKSRLNRGREALKKILCKV